MRKVEHLTDLEVRQWFALNDRDYFDAVVLKESLQGKSFRDALKEDLYHFGCKAQKEGLRVSCVINRYCTGCYGIRWKRR
ncbi:hypothetical protein [Shewanella algae]|uniref:hypothetical protein n=1 Tax=Shewanella algae TaxID=38313 RepID=UPI0031F58F64